MENDKMKENGETREEGERKKKKRTSMSRPKKIISIIQLCVLLGIVLGIPASIYFFNPGLLDNFTSVDKFESWISEYTGAGIIIYIACQIIQIVLSVLPGQVIQIAGGYIFGFPLTLLISVAGATIGTTITFYLTKLLGKNAIIMIFGEERFNRYANMMNTQRARIVIFLGFDSRTAEGYHGVCRGHLKYPSSGIHPAFRRRPDSRYDGFHRIWRHAAHGQLSQCCSDRSSDGGHRTDLPDQEKIHHGFPRKEKNSRPITRRKAADRIAVPLRDAGYAERILPDLP